MKLLSGSYGGNDGGMYSSSYGGDYMSRSGDVCSSPFLNIKNADNCILCI